MTAPPTDVLTERLQQAVGGRPVSAAVFTTFRLEPAFFEQEILTALFDVPWHHAAKLRRLQFEDVLRPLSGRLAVYYDHRGLLEGDLGSAALDVRRIPCWPTTGYFHPKVIFVLVQDDAGRALVAMTSSANLTRAGWWENVEAAAIEELREGDASRMRDELVAFADHLRRQTSDLREHAALDEVRDFLRTVDQLSRRSARGRLHPHFYANGRTGARSLTDFIADTTRGAVDGWSLDVISPYVDDATTSEPLAQLSARFRPRSVRVLVPEHDGVTRCSQAFYETVRASGARWARLPDDLTYRGPDERATARPVHAKVYRFFEGEREILFVGSVNLTNAGHQSGGNVEAGVLLERRHDRRQRHWLALDEAPPAFFEPTEEEEGVEEHAPKLALRYDWSSGRLSALWGSRADNPRLRIRAHGVHLFDVGAATLPARAWQEVSGVRVDVLEDQLQASSFVTAVDDDGREGVLLVLEVGMAHRPSLLLQLTPAEILQYWALLTPDQRAEYVGERGEMSDDVSEGEALVAAARRDAPPESMFDRFAGMFHGFASLERKLIAALEDDRAVEAEFLVVGKKPDSLRRLVDRVVERTGSETQVDDYLLLLCAEQLVRRIKTGWTTFWQETPGTTELEVALARRSDVRTSIVDAGDRDTDRFLGWYEKKFLQPVRRPA